MKSDPVEKNFQTKLDSRQSILLLILITQLSVTLVHTQAPDDLSNSNNRNRISGKFLGYINGPGHYSSSYSPNTTFQEGGTPNSKFRRILIEPSSWQEAYQKLVDNLRRVRTMMFSDRKSNETETEVTDSSLSSEESGSGFNLTSTAADADTTSLSSNRTGRLHGSPLWSFPDWTVLRSSSSGAGIGSTSTPRSRIPLNRIFFGTYQTPEVAQPPPSTYYPAPPPGSPGANLFGNQDSSSYKNYVYKYNPKTTADFEAHTTTTIYIICICLVVMLVGTIMFALVSKCQGKRGQGQATSTRRRRSRSGAASSGNAGSQGQGSSRPTISIIMPEDGANPSAPPAYPKVAYDAPPSYDSLFPEIGKV